MVSYVRLGIAAIALSAQGSVAMAQSSAADEIAKYRAALQDGNPADLWEIKGESLWTQKRGPKNASLEQCNLGLGPGVVKGASAQLPRYFADTKKVQDLETRLMTCMETLQGIDTKDIKAAKWGKGEMANLEAIVTYVVANSRDVKVNVDMKPPQMKQMYALGEKAFFYRAGPFDFSCASCHGEDDKRIRMQDLPNISTPKGAAAGWTSWPAYRVSNSEMWTMQHRLQDCFRQQRFPEPIYGSDVTIALSVFMAAKSKGEPMATPGIKR